MISEIPILHKAYRLECLALGQSPDALSSDSLEYLNEYKYKSEDKSLLSYYVLNPFWTWCAGFMPPRLAPNLITVIGVSAILFGLVLVELFIADLSSASYPLIYFFGAFAVIFYQTMDNIDGKQARKTGSSSPLGELFDHGIDSLNCCWCGLLEAGCMGLGSTGHGALTTFCTCFAMYLSTWETYHTHVLFLGFLNGPTEGLVMASLMMAISGAWGPQVWNTRIIDLPGSLGPILSAIFGFGNPNSTMKDMWSVMLYISVLGIHAPFCVYNVYQAKRQRKEPFLPAALQVTPLLVLTASVCLWTMCPHSIVLKDNHLVLFGMACSFIFGRVTTSIILAHLTKQPFPSWSLPMIPLAIGSVLFGVLPRFDIRFSPNTELVYLWSMLAFSLLYFAAYSRLVIHELCEFLGIRCFTIKPKHL